MGFASGSSAANFCLRERVSIVFLGDRRGEDHLSCLPPAPISLAPGFSRVFAKPKRHNRFSGFWLYRCG